MPRKIKAEQAGRFAKNFIFAHRSRNQWPNRTVWGTGRFAEIALDRWIARHDCDGTCEGPGSCDAYRRVSRVRAAYGKRRGRKW